MQRRDLIRASLALGATSALPLAAPAIAQAPKVIKFVPQSDLTVIDPVVTTAYVTRHHALMIFDQLYGIDKDFRPQPQMAEGHEVASDGLSVRIRLREGLKFHDGAPVLARDAVASIRRWAVRDAMGQAMMAATDELSAPDDRTIQFRLKKPFPLLIDALAKPGTPILVVMPERLAKGDAAAPITEFMGSGPFRFVAGERVPGSRLVYERNRDYVPRADGPVAWTSGPKKVNFDRVEWHVLPDQATAAAALQNGEVDWLEQPIADIATQLKRNRNIQVEVSDPTGFMSLARFNHLHPPFDNPAIRRALLPGIRQADYMTAILGDDRSLWNDRCGFFLPGSPLASEVGLETMNGAPDYDKVKRNLEAAGYKGERVVFVVPADNHRLNAMSEVAGDMLRRVGMNLDYQVSDWGTVAARLSNRGGLDQGGWSVWCNTIPGVIALNPATQSYLRGPGKAGTFGWPDLPKIEALRDRFMEAEEFAEQKSIAEAMQRQAFEDIPYLPTGALTQPTAFRSNITGMLEGFPIFHNIRKE